MSNKVFQPYFDYPVNPGLLYIKCTQCGKNYASAGYAKELSSGDPAYYLLENNQHTHFCGASCVGDYMNYTSNSKSD